jgi:uncharacterized protein
VAYLDSSAYVKLPLREAERQALMAELVRWDGYVSSTLMAVESLRACARYGTSYERAARIWMDGLSLLPIDDAILDVAADLRPWGLRSLDALHVATAVSLGDDLAALITYDDRLALAAEEQGLPVARPV